MKITLERLKITNFKGLENFELDLKGKSAEIRGRNGTGKSTIADAWYWLMSGKDSENQANFNVLRLDANGVVIDHTNAEVEATIRTDKKMTLKKIYKQKWTKKRGKAEPEMTGHTTNHFIDAVPVSQREYQDKLDKLISDRLFRILSDVRYFCAETTADLRRNILLEITGDIADNDVIANNPELAELDSILNERELVSHRKIVNARRKQINDLLDHIPTRIDEKKRDLPDISKHDEVTLRKELNRFDDEIAEKVKELGKLATGLNINELKKKIADLQATLALLDADTTRENSKKVSEKLSEKTIAEKLLATSKLELDKTQNRIAEIENNMIHNADLRTDLINRWHEEHEKKLPQENVCFNCGQDLPESIILEQKGNFNLQQSKILKEINDKGQSLFEDYNKMKGEKEGLIDLEKKQLETIKKRKEEIEAIEKEIHHINNENSVEYGKKQVELTTAIAKYEEKIEELRHSIQPEKDVLKTAISALEEQKDIVDAKLREITHYEKSQARIRELTRERKQLAAEYEQTEKELWLIDEFSRKKAEFIEENVSEHFTITKWKLFEIQQNGGLRDICEPTVDGVPYSTDLNNGARILCGLDCINAISKHFDIQLPVFIDNAESLTKPDDIDIPYPHQFITLVVDTCDDLEIRE